MRHYVSGRTKLRRGMHVVSRNGGSLGSQELGSSTYSELVVLLLCYCNLGCEDDGCDVHPINHHKRGEGYTLTTKTCFTHSHTIISYTYNQGWGTVYGQYMVVAL